MKIVQEYIYTSGLGIVPIAFASPMTTLKTPGGTPARCASSAIASAVSGVDSAGFNTTCEACGPHDQKVDSARHVFHMIGQLALRASTPPAGNVFHMINFRLDPSETLRAHAMLRHPFSCQVFNMQ